MGTDDHPPRDRANEADAAGAGSDAVLQAVLESLPEAPVCVGFSGGLDSTVLLHALARTPAARTGGVRAVHVDHGLHADAADWSASCARVCETLGVPLAVEQVRVDVGDHGLEAAARAARHAAFARQLAAGETLALAHHRDDEAETVLLRLLRGSGSAALGAMAVHGVLEGRTLWRPLIATPRERLLAYAHAHGLGWIEDPANADPRHDRNLLRHTILPQLRARWPGADAALARSARLLREDGERLLRLDRQLLAGAQGVDPRTLSVPALRALHDSEARAVLRAWLRSLSLPTPPAAVIDRVGEELLDARDDATPRMRWPGAELRRYRDLLYAMPPLPPADRDWSLAWDGGSTITLPRGFGHLALDADPPAAPAALTVRPRAGGECLLRTGRTQHESLKHVLQQLGVPPWIRERTPLVFDEHGTLLAAADLVHADAWTQRFPNAHLLWTPTTPL